MSIKIDYPRDSFARSLELAEKLFDIGETSRETLADSAGRKLSGAFSTLISAAIKYNLIEIVSDDKVRTTTQVKELKLSYSDEEKVQLYQQCVLQPGVFRAIHDRFLGKKLPDILDKILAREFKVEKSSPQIATYLREAFQSAHLISPDGMVLPQILDIETPILVESDSSSKLTLSSVFAVEEEKAQQVSSNNYEPLGQPPNTGFYSVSVIGPDMRLIQIDLKDQDDFTILDATIRKIKRKLGFEIAD